MSSRGLADGQMGGDFDYTFTETELADILGFMETQQTHQHEPPTYVPSAPFPHTPGTAMPLQFQPHTSDSLGGHPTPSHSGGSASDEGATIKREASAGHVAPIKQEQASSLAGLNGFFANPTPKHTGGTATSRSPLAMSADALPLETGMRNHSGSGTSHFPAASQKKESAKGHISHSTVEKQRRDRINSLIDELRDMVPPQTPNSVAQDGLDSKRPKHVVLSDTIQLIRDLQFKARLSDSPSGTDPGQEATDLFQRTYHDNSRRSDPDNTKPSSPPELPLAPEGALPASGVVVEQGDGCLYVKVNCKDRRGLLSDIITSLKAIPLEITTAAVTTTGNGYVHDVFQVKMEPDSRVSPQDIQCHVHATMYSLTESTLGDKRRRLRG